MKRKINYFVFALTMFLGLMCFAGLGNVNSSLSARAEESKHIDFTLDADYTKNYGDDTLLIDTVSQTSHQVTITYKVVYNDGVNSLVFVPSYNKTVFNIATVLVNDESSHSISWAETSLGDPTITGFETGEDVIRLAFESENMYEGTSGENESFVTIVYNVINANAEDEDYVFSLVLPDPQAEERVHNTVSEAYQYLDGTSLGEQEEIEIRVTSATVKILTVKTAQITIGANADFDDDNVDDMYAFTYGRLPVSMQRVSELPETVDNLKVSYTFLGSAQGYEPTATPVVKWYSANYNDLTTTYTKGSELNPQTAPSSVDYYFVGVSAPAGGVYKAVDEVIRLVRILPIRIVVKADDQSSQYSENLVSPLRYTMTGALLDGDSANFSITTNANKNAVGSYDITVSGYIQDSNEQQAAGYDITFIGGVYTVTAYTLTITALDQSAPWTGSEPSVDNSKYTIKHNETTLNNIDFNFIVTINKEQGTEVGDYTLTPNASGVSSSYSVSYINGTFHITSAGKDAEYIASFFSADEVTYDRQQHNLLIVDSGIPAWIANNYTASNNLKTNAGTYTITINVNLDDTTAHNYTNDVKVFNITVENAKINKKAITISPESKYHYYGGEPMLLTPTSVGVGGEISLTLHLEDKTSHDTVALSSSTNVGSYDIVATYNSSFDSNYTITNNKGTYDVLKGNASVSVSASNVYYNRGLDITSSASVGSLNLTPNVVVYSSNNDVWTEVSNKNAVLPAGSYKAVASVAGNDNYNGDSKECLFSIEKVYLALPTVSYNKNTATWTEVTKDYGLISPSMEPKDLVEGTTVSYSINNVAISGRTYTAQASDVQTGLILSITSNNDNYYSSSMNLKAVYAVTFAEGSHPLTPDSATGMPATQYRFDGESADEPSNPTVTGYTFKEWRKSEESSAFAFSTTAISADTTIVAIWDVNSYTITFLYFDDADDEDVNMFEFSIAYGSAINYSELNLAPVKETSETGVSYEYNGKWTSNNVEYTVENGVLAGYTVQGAATFVAQYNTIYASFNVFYYVRENGGEYVKQDGSTTAQYGSTIAYRVALETEVKWFAARSWFSNEAATEPVLTVMPNHDINVYGEIVFDIGLGDVNGNHSVDTDDITLYRRWIVGGYDIVVVESGKEWATATDKNFDDTKTYFLARVADNNVDLSQDIRDVSVTRMAIVGGYTWDIRTGLNVTGQEIKRNDRASTVEGMVNSLNAGNQVTLLVDITDAEADVNIVANKNVYLDLNGKTLTVQSFSVVSSENVTITIMNGSIVTTEGITISAPNGDVVLTDVTGYDANGLVNLAAGSNSLHINGVVEFKEGNNAPAAVKVAEGTHLVIEEKASVKVQKLVVTDSEFHPTENPQASISIKNNSAVSAPITVEGNFVDENAVSTVAELREAATRGGTITLAADMDYTGRVEFSKDTKLVLNGKTLNSTAGSTKATGLGAINGAKLTIEGNGNVTAVEGCVMAFNGSTVVINGGTYTCKDNFVVGTNGSAGKGENTITINGGTFNGGIVSAGYVACGVYVANSDTVTINGGTFNVTNGVGVLARSGNTTIGEDVVFNVTGAGTLGKVGDSQVTVPSGEALVLDRAAGYPGGMPTLTNNNTNYNVYINGNINDVNSLVYAIINGGNYKVTADVIFSGQASFGKDTKIDLNGHTLRSTNDVALSATNGATLTIEGNGNVIAKEMCAMAFYASTLIINGGTYTAIDNAVFGTNGTVKADDDQGHNIITINDGIFNGGIVSAGYVACGVYVANSDTVTINGGTFNITNGVGVLARSGNTTIGANVLFNVTGDGALGKVGDSQVTVPSGEALVLDLAANYPGGKPTLTNNSNYSIYCVGGAVVSTAQELVSALENNNVIYLLADILPDAAVSINKTVTIYGNGHKLKVNISGNGTVTLNNVWTTNITVSENGFTGTLIFNGGVLDTDRPGTDDPDAAFYSKKNPNASFEFRGMSISANITKGIKIFNAKSVLIDNCVFDAEKLSIIANAVNSNIQSLSLVDIQLQNDGANITITNSTFIGAPQGSTAVPSSVYGYGTMADSDTGAAIKLKVEAGAHFGNVTISGNTFTNNYRDIVVGTGAYANQLQVSATAASNGRSGDGLQYNTIDGWNIENNTTTLTANVVANRGVATLSYVGGPSNFNKFTTRVGNIGELVGGVAIWNIGKVLEKENGVWYYVEGNVKYAVSTDGYQVTFTPAN